MFKQNKLMAAAFAVGLLAMAGAASAQTAVQGGGATLPENLYKGVPSNLGRLLPTNFVYNGVSSGAGKTAFLTNTGTGISLTGTVHYVGSDSVLTSTEFSTYNTAYNNSSDPNRYGPLIQIPAVGTAVALPYKLGAINDLQLTGEEACRVFSGFNASGAAVTNWSDVRTGLPATAIRVVYRSGSSGTTELLTRFLNDSCQTRIHVNGTFTSAKVSGGIPSNWQVVSGSGDVVSAVDAVDGSIGYVSPDYTQPVTNARVARVSKNAVAAGTAPLPTATATTLGLGTAALPAAADRADPLNWVRTFGNTIANTTDNPTPATTAVPTSIIQYPIVGYTNFLIGQCYKDASVTNQIRSFLTDLYTGTKNTIITNHGFASVPTSSATPDNFAAEIKKVFLDNSEDDGLDIGNSAVCSAIGRPL